VVEAARRMEQDGADAIVFIVGTWIFSSIIISAVNDLHVPFVLYGLSDDVANGNLGASIQIKYVLKEMGKRFLYLCGPARDDQNEREILRYVRAAWVTHAMRNRRLATIGGKCMMMYQTQVNEFDWKRVFGIDFPQYDASQVFKEMGNVSDEEARAVEADFLKRVDAVHWQLDNGESLPEDAVFFQAKLYLAFKRLQKLYGIDFFANKCMPEMSAIPYGPGCAACLATAMLNDDGIITACEADVPAGISMYMLNLLTGQKVFFADIARLHKGENGITFFNCGTAPISMADREKGVELWPIPGNIADEAVPRAYACGKMNGACIRMELKEGMKVTVMRLGGNGESLRMHVANATTIRRSVMPDEVIGQRWPGFGLEFEEDRKEFLKNTVGHHYSLVVGDWAEELRVIAGLYGIGYVFNH
jgi:L-fucose isomerase-like protein